MWCLTVRLDVLPGEPHFPQNPAAPATSLAWYRMVFSLASCLPRLAPLPPARQPSREALAERAWSTDSSSSSQSQKRVFLGLAVGAGSRAPGPWLGSPKWLWLSQFLSPACSADGFELGMGLMHQKHLTVALPVLTLPVGSCHWPAEGNPRGMPYALGAFQNAGS